MVFSSVLFIFLFLPIALVCNYVIRENYRNYFLLLASLIFFAWGASWFVATLIAGLSFDFFWGVILGKVDNKKNNIRRMLLTLSIVSNLGLLAYFKYANFFINELNMFMSWIGLNELNWTSVVLPIGISFITFHKISYIVDIYRRTVKPFNNLLNYFLYILFFPQLIAGPIVRFHEISDQILLREQNKERFIDGIWRFSIGIGKKVLIANNLGIVTDKIFSMEPSELNITTAWIGILLYTFQIYFDFSGYSDMAIGLGKMFGFELPENFNRPYISRSITEFWRRWHMSLSRFLRDYLYIPLGGNRCSKLRNYINLWIVFLLCGLWHGANWTFVVWGIYHGIFLVADKLFLLNRLNKFNKYISITVTFLAIMIGWVFFRSPSIGYAFAYICEMFNPISGDLRLLVEISNQAIVISFLTFILTFFSNDFVCRLQNNVIFKPSLPVLKWLFSFLILLYSCAMLSIHGFNPFIYFQF